MMSRQRVYRTEAVVLRRMDLGEADRLLTLFTPDEGKVRAIAKGVRRPGSRKSGHLEPFSRTRLLLARGRELDIITQAEAVDLYPTFRQDLERLGAAAYVVELLDRFTVQEGDSRGPYELLIGALDQLEAGADLAPLCRYYELRLLDLVGYRPQLFHCVECEAEIEPEDQYFSSAQGGVLCPRCGQGHREATRISLAALKVLRHYQRSGYAEAVAPNVRTAVHEELESLMESYLIFLLERRLNAPKFLRRVRGLRRAGLKSDAAT
ncbi:MAG: DNA repair protein RecO [Anaerolineales bacterium]|nr:DNA repair protein RecO [Anaerolineales bacterium]